MAVTPQNELREGERRASDRAGCDQLCHVFQMNLVDDAGARREHPKVPKRLGGPFEDGIALAVAVELDREVLRDRILRPRDFDDERVIDHEVHRDRQIHGLRIDAAPGGFPAQSRQIEQNRQAARIGQDRTVGLQGDRRTTTAGPVREADEIGLGRRIGECLPRDVLGQKAKAVGRRAEPIPQHRAKVDHRMAGREALCGDFRPHEVRRRLQVRSPPGSTRSERHEIAQNTIDARKVPLHPGRIGPIALKNRSGLAGPQWCRHWSI